MAEKSSSLYKRSDVVCDFDCSSCNENGINTQAHHFCKDCDQGFCGQCITYHNKVLKKHTVLGRKDVSQWSAVPSKVDASVRCDQHQTKSLELYCEDHDQLCCHICVSLDHRQCAAVKHIPDVAKGIHDSPDFKRIPDKMKKLRHAWTRLSTTGQKQRSNLDISRKKVLGQIQTMRRDVNKASDNLEAELDKLKSTREQQVLTDVEKIEDGINLIQTMLDDIQEGRDKRESTAFISFKKCEEILTQAQSAVYTMEMFNDMQLDFQPYTGLLDFVSTLTKVGQVSCTGGPASFLPGPEHIFVKKSETVYNVYKGCDQTTHPCSIIDICVFPTGKTVILFDNSLTSINDKYTIITSHHLTRIENPRAMFYVDTDEVVVASVGNNKCTLQYIRVKDGILEYKDAHQLRHSCSSMAIHGGRLFVLSNDSTLFFYPAIGSQGKVLRNLYVTANPFSRIAVSPGGSKILLFQYLSHTITTLNLDGTVHDKFSYPEVPTAFHVSPAGHVFVGCANGAVLQTSRDGTRTLATIVKHMQTMVCHPFTYRSTDRDIPVRCLCYNIKTGYLVVGYEGSQQIHVIKLE